MEELDKEIKASDGSLDLEGEKDVVSGSQKRKYTETQSVKIAKFGQPLRKHSKIESSSKEEQAQEEEEEEEEDDDDIDDDDDDDVGYFEIGVLYKRTCEILRHKPDDYTFKYENDPFLEEAERQRINQTKLSQEEVSDADEDLWFSEDEDDEEEEIQDDQFDQKDEEKDEDDDGTEEEEEDEDDDKKEEDKDCEESKEKEDDEGKYDLCLYGRGPCRSCTENERMLAAWSKTKKEFCELVLRRPDIKDGSSAQQIYRRLKEANLKSTMHKSKAIEFINFAIRYYSKDKSRQLSKSVKKLISLVPCITIDNFDKGFISSVVRDARDVGHCLFDIFFAVERIFHPLIRKKNIKEIVWISKRNAKVEYRKNIQQCMAVPFPFPWAALKEHRDERISQEALQDAFCIVQLHQDFDRHLAYSSLLNEKSKIAELMSDDNVVTTRFKELDSSLMKASLRWRVRLLKKILEYKRYIAWLRPIVELKAKKGNTILDSVLEAVRKVYPDFPNLSEECILDQKPEELSSFCELLSEIKRYLNCPVSHRYLVDGIVVYLKLCSDLGKTKTETEKWDVFATLRNRFLFRLDKLEKVWGTRHYEHPAYKTLFGP